MSRDTFKGMSLTAMEREEVQLDCLAMIAEALREIRDELRLMNRA